MTRLRDAITEPRWYFGDEPVSVGDLLAAVGAGIAILTLFYLFVLVMWAASL